MDALTNKAIKEASHLADQMRWELGRARFSPTYEETDGYVDRARASLALLSPLLGFDLVPRKSSEASRADHEYRVLNGCAPPVTEATDKFDGRNSSRVDQPAAEGM